jgi:hypothetical protein
LDVAEIFKEDVLTVGFARRFATYKRPDLLLHDPERLIRLLTDSQRPVQLILAGKAHPEDMPGQALIKRWNDFIKRPEVRGRVVFLSDYDMQMAQELVKGMDLWINTPRRPWEACGTSGMKVLANGGLNISELDGWWAEAYTPEIGWAIGDGREHGEDAAWDASEVGSLYTLLEQQVVPEFYDRDAQGLPSRWLGRVRESMATLTPEFSASRAIREYTNDHYLPAAAGYNARAANDGKLGAELLQWQRSIAEQWTRSASATCHRRDKGWPTPVPNRSSLEGSIQINSGWSSMPARPARVVPSLKSCCVQIFGRAVWHDRLFRLLSGNAAGHRLYGTPRSIARRASVPLEAGRFSGSDERPSRPAVSCPYPLGATVCPDGTNFSIFSASASGMQLVLFDHADDRVAARTVTLDPVRNRTSHYWHIFLPGIKPGNCMGIAQMVPCDPAAGQRFDPQKVLIDPYGKGVSIGHNYSRAAACKPGDNASTSMKSVVADLSLFDWEDDKPINRLFRDTVIYEMHVAGFTRDPSSGVAAANRGTYLGVIEKIPYLQSLGITAVELLPVFQFDSRTHRLGWPTTGVTIQSPSSLHTLRTAPTPMIRSPVSMSFARW